MNPETLDSVNEVTTVGEMGFYRMEGPWTVEKAGTVWTVVVPEGQEPTGPDLETTEGQGAVLIADGRTVGGGIVCNVETLPSEGETLLQIDQYARD